MIEEFSKIIRMEPTKEDLEKLKKFESKFDNEIMNELEDLYQSEDNKNN